MKQAGNYQIEKCYLNQDIIHAKQLGSNWSHWLEDR